MKKILILCNLVFTFTALTFSAENPIRFRDLLFEDIKVTEDIHYGTNKSQAGLTEKLLLDIYEPANDTLLKRPLILLAHGGYFLMGSKADMALECENLAQAGYVVVSINYRLIDVAESVMSYKRAGIDAISDMKAAVRFFVKDAATNNQYKIDAENIFIGGYSAGAITSLHYAYANTVEDGFLMGGEEMLEYISLHGGTEGDSGNPGYSSTVRGVINIAGSLYDADMVDANEPVLFSVHGTADDIVPYEIGKSGNSDVTTEGSGLIHQRAAKVGLINQLVTVEGGDHFAFFGCMDCHKKLRSFVFENLK